MVSLLSSLLYFVVYTATKYNIDESHGLTHSMDVLHNVNNIYELELPKYPYLKSQEKVIFISAILHDMCDKKYMNEYEGIRGIEELLKTKIEPSEIEMIKKIISTMSYSKVKQNGYPDLGEYQQAYHIVREADLLAGYNFDRCMIYNMLKNQGDIHDSFTNAYFLFQKRMFQHHNDNLFSTTYGMKQSIILHQDAIARINTWKQIIRTPSMK
jgi:hypothetical protein